MLLILYYFTNNNLKQMYVNWMLKFIETGFFIKPKYDEQFFYALCVVKIKTKCVPFIAVYIYCSKAAWLTTGRGSYISQSHST